MRSTRGVAFALVVGTLLGGCIIRTRGRAHGHAHTQKSQPAVRDHRRNDPPPPPPPQPVIRDHRN